MEQKPLPPHRNQILDALPQAERERLFPHLRHVVLPLGMVIYESGARLRDIYFPTNSIVSLLYVLANGSSAEIAVVGRRWLLLSLDRLDSNEMKMTQELIANMLGVRREGVTEAARRLQAGGVIRYSRGKITVLDRARLEQLSCECYEVVKKESDRLLGPEGRPAGPDFHPTV